MPKPAHTAGLHAVQPLNLTNPETCPNLIQRQIEQLIPSPKTTHPIVHATWFAAINQPQSPSIPARIDHTVERNHARVNLASYLNTNPRPYRNMPPIQQETNQEFEQPSLLPPAHATNLKPGKRYVQAL